MDSKLELALDYYWNENIDAEEFESYNCLLSNLKLRRPSRHCIALFSTQNTILLNNKFCRVKEASEIASFGNIYPSLILFYSNFEDCSILSKRRFAKLQSETTSLEELHFGRKIIPTELFAILMHPKMKAFKHSILSLHPHENFAQVLSKEILFQVCHFFLLCENSSLKIGFNSNGDITLLPNLHFELLFVDELGIEEVKLPIENVNYEIQSHWSKLEKLETEITLSITKDPYPVFLLSKKGLEKEKIYLVEVFCEIANDICTEINRIGLTFHLLWSDKGDSLYIIASKSRIKEIPLLFESTWLEFAGIHFCYDQTYYEGLNEDNCTEGLSQLIPSIDELEGLLSFCISLFSNLNK